MVDGVAQHRLDVRGTDMDAPGLVAAPLGAARRRAVRFAVRFRALLDECLLGRIDRGNGRLSGAGRIRAAAQASADQRFARSRGGPGDDGLLASVRRAGALLGAGGGDGALVVAAPPQRLVHERIFAEDRDPGWCLADSGLAAYGRASEG